MAAIITEALFGSVADTLAEIEAEKPGDTLADVKVETPLSALGDTLSYVEAKTIGYTLPDVKAETIVAFLADTVEGDTARDIYQQTGQHKGQDTRQNSTLRNIKAKALVRDWQER